MIATTSLTPNICFYIHHHGAGHLMRALTISNALHDLPVCFIGSNLKPFLHLIPQHITCIHLSADVPADNETIPTEAAPSFLHYAPLGLRGQRERTAAITEIFKTLYPLLLVVDVSVEITLLARLCGVPTIIIRQHGNRNDLPHLQAYESAELLIAPFSKAMSVPSQDKWVDQKTLFAGGFSRYTPRKQQNNEEEMSRHIAFLVGEGGTSIDNQFIVAIANACNTYTFHVIGQLALSPSALQHNIIWHGKVSEPELIISNCAVVIGNAGHNTVMEMAALNKRFICIPEERPFNEQQQKAEIIERNGNARVIQAEDLEQVNWNEELEMILSTPADWNGVIAPDAIHNIAAAVYKTLQRLFLYQQGD